MTTRTRRAKQQYQKLPMENPYAPTLLNRLTRGKVIESIEIVNERMGRAIDIYFRDQTCLSFSLVVTLNGFMKLCETGTGDFENSRSLGRIPPEEGIYDGEKDDD